MHVVGFIIRNRVMGLQDIQGGSNMTETDFCVNKPHMSRSYLNHLVIWQLCQQIKCSETITRHSEGSTQQTNHSLCWTMFSTAYSLVIQPYFDPNLFINNSLPVNLAFTPHFSMYVYASAALRRDLNELCGLSAR